MESVAADLKLEREKRKISLAQIAADTRISMRHLQSLEEGRYADLPGGIYNRAFLKAYCESINIDQSEILQRYDAEITPPPERPPNDKPHFSEPATVFRPSPIVLWSMMLLISASGVFFSRKWIAAVFSPYFSHAPIASVRYESAPEVSTASISQIPVSSASELSVLATGELPPSAPTSLKADDNLSIAENQAISQAGFVRPAASVIRSLQLELEVTEKCWISVDSDGSSVVRKTLEPGEVQLFSADDNFHIIVGNAGGVQLRLNGKPVKPLGKTGEVIKMIINAKNLQDLIAQTAG